MRRSLPTRGTAWSSASPSRSLAHASFSCSRSARPAVGAAGAAFSLVRAGLQAYGFLVDVVALAFILFAGTGVFALFARLRSMRRAVSLAWLVSLGLALARIAVSPIAVAEGREILVPTSQVAARLDRLLVRDTRGANLRIDPFERVRCRPLVPPARLPPFALPAPGPRNLLLVSVDALRSDAVGWERRGRPLMPNLSRFFAGSVYAKSAVTTYPATVFAVGSALTGVHPSRALFAPSVPRTVLSRIGAQIDVRSIHLPSAPWFEGSVDAALFLDGLDASFDRDASVEVDGIVEELGRARAAGRSYAVWAHFYEPHQPHERHPGFAFGSSTRDLYAGEVAYLDGELGRLFDFLERSGAYRDTLVVFFADHGEGLGERRHFGHHVFLDAFLTDVPVAVRAPGLAPRAVEGVVELTDVAATIAHFFGVEQNAGSVGWSLLAGDPPADRVAISEAFPIRGTDLFAIANRPVRTLAELDARMARIHEHDAARYAPKVALVTRDFRWSSIEKPGFGSSSGAAIPRASSRTSRVRSLVSSRDSPVASSAGSGTRAWRSTARFARWSRPRGPCLQRRPAEPAEEDKDRGSSDAEPAMLRVVQDACR